MIYLIKQAIIVACTEKRGKRVVENDTFRT